MTPGCLGCLKNLGTRVKDTAPLRPTRIYSEINSGLVLDTSVGLWLNLQLAWHLYEAEKIAESKAD